MSPMFAHDCPHCKLYATIDINGEPHDVYECENRDYKGVVVRFGNDGPDYTSASNEILKYMPKDRLVSIGKRVIDTLKEIQG